MVGDSKFGYDWSFWNFAFVPNKIYAKPIKS